RRWRPDLLNTSGTCGGGYGYYAALQRARYLAEYGTRRIEGFPDAQVPGKTGLLAQLAAYAGYSYALLGEGFCEMAIDEGPRMTRAEVWTKAEEWFTKALNLAANDASILNLARVGRARVRLNLGRGAEAAGDADQVPVGYVRNAGYSTATTRRENRVYNANVAGRDISVAPLYRGLTVGGVPDSRVPVAYTNRTGTDQITPQWDQLKYTARNSPIPIASWDEAQLVIAEVRGGQEAFDTINRLRTRANLPLLAPGTVVDLGVVLEERRRELFSEGHRYNDMLRHDLPFPTGVDHKGQIYGDVTCLPLPNVEILNNPNLD
ncbi:MAG: RagB/SusD family nutrient uptake outer membrane protein, partial [Gemmatimonadetes bacterium]|nr:RagB/SusD family nutrient uptake outer membrane protein [Gemmatimonadota bacterium]